MPDDFPLMPVTSGGPTAPLETPTTGASQHPASNTLGDVFGAAYRSSPVVTAMMRGYGDLAYGSQTVPRDKATEIVKAQGLDPAFIGKDGIGYGALQEEIQRQGEIKLRQLSLQREGGAGALTTIAGGLGAGIADPSSLVLGPAAGAIADLARGGFGIRAAVGATEGMTYQGAMSAGQAHMTGHDDDILSWQTLHDMTFAGILGAAGGAAFGPRARAPQPSEFSGAVTKVLQTEGGTTTDTGGLTKFGISANAHPGIDIANLTQSQATDIYKTQYWDAIGADKLSPELRMTAFDAAVNQGVGKTKAMLKQAKGDPAAFNALREAEYRRLAASDPEKYGPYLQGWLNRLKGIGSESGTDVARAGTESGTDISRETMQPVQDAPRSEGEPPVQGVQPGEYGDLAGEGAPEAAGDAGSDFRTNPFRIADEHAAEVTSLETEAFQRMGRRSGEDMARAALAKFANDDTALPETMKQSAIPEPVQATMRMQDERANAAPAAKPMGGAAAEMAESTTAVRNSLPEDQHEAFDHAVEMARTQPEEGTNMRPEELDKAVTAAIRCGVLKGVSYGGN